jgi:hypothetical protein
LIKINVCWIAIFRIQLEFSLIVSLLNQFPNRVTIYTLKINLKKNLLFIFLKLNNKQERVLIVYNEATLIVDAFYKF